MSSAYDSFLDRCIDDYYNDLGDIELDIEDILLYHSLNDDCLSSLDSIGISDADEYFYTPEQLALERENIWRKGKTF